MAERGAKGATEAAVDQSSCSVPARMTAEGGSVLSVCGEIDCVRKIVSLVFRTERASQAIADWGFRIADWEAKDSATKRREKGRKNWGCQGRQVFLPQKQLRPPRRVVEKRPRAVVLFRIESAATKAALRCPDEEKERGR